MSDVLNVATRKGLFRFRREDGAWRAGAPAFLGEPVSFVMADPRDGAVYAALNLGHFGIKLHRSDDQGETWAELPCPAFDKAEDSEDAKDAPSVDMIWSLTPGPADQPGLLFCGTIPGGLFVSRDRGESWSLNQNLWPHAAGWFGGGYDKAGIHTVLADPRDPQRMVLAVSTGGVWVSQDMGESWDSVGRGLRAAYMPPEQAFVLQAQDVHRLAACAADPDTVWCQHHNGVFLSRDGGRTFAELEPTPSAFGFAVAAHPKDRDTAWFVPAIKDERRVPVNAALVVTRTRDGGRTFEALSNGLPGVSYDLIYRHGLDVDATGRRLAMGSTTGNLWTSEDGGDNWTLVGGHLPPIAQVAFG